MNYISSILTLSKPYITYLSIRLSFLITTYTGEWYSGRIYSKYCIGEGINGYFNHIWNMASPSCTGILATHVSLLGIFIASIGLTLFTGILYLYNNHIKEEYKNTKKIIENIN